MPDLSEHVLVTQATNIVRAFRAVGKVQPETGIPAAVLRGAAGFAILSIAKASLVGIRVARRKGARTLTPTCSGVGASIKPEVPELTYG